MDDDRKMAIHTRRTIAHLLVLLCCVCSESVAQNHGSILRVTVADAATGVFLLDAEVAVRKSDPKARTNFLGETTIGGLSKGVYMNGVRVSDGNAWILPLDQLGGVEYYNPGFIPVQYMDAASVGASGSQGGSPACGVMLLWSP